MNYTTRTSLRTRNFIITMAVLLSVIIALVWLNLSDIGRQKTWDVEIPMTNSNVNWIQTYHPGPWE